MEIGDWRTEWQSESRQRIVNQIFDGLTRYTPFSGKEGLNELWEIAIRYDEKYYIAASSESDYLKRICLKLLKLEEMSQNIANAFGKCSNLPHSGSQSMQSQLNSQGLSLPIPFLGNNFQEGQQPFPQNIPNDVASTGIESSTGLLFASPSKSSLTQILILNVVENHNKQKISNLSQISIKNLIGQNAPFNIFPNSSGQIQKGQEGLFQKQQQAFQQQLLYQRQSLYQQVLQQSFLMKKLQQWKSQASNLLLQRQNLIDQQNQLYLSQQTLKTSSTFLDAVKQKTNAIGDDWQEKAYQKIKAMKEKYLAALSEMHQKIIVLLEQGLQMLMALMVMLRQLVLP